MRTFVLSLLVAATATSAFAQDHRGGGFHGGGFHGDGRGRGSHDGYGRDWGYSPRLAVRPYRTNEWHAHYPAWHERYYTRGGRYYYDPVYRYPAVVDNEWGSIAALSGGVALLGAFNHDPYLTFGGAAGALYSLSRYQHDLHSGDRNLRLRATYFNRPYFWRNGVRYDRATVYQNGHEYYRFHRH